ncbi:MAG: hypothetical protein ACLFT6_08395 [Bacteroidales bacterium]
MKQVKNKSRLLPALILLTLIICHSERVSLDYHIQPNAYYNKDSAKRFTAILPLALKRSCE